MPAADNHQPESSGLHKHGAAPSDSLCPEQTLGAFSEPLLTADLSQGQVPPWASAHAWGTISARLRGMFLNKTREDIKLCFFVLCFSMQGMVVWHLSGKQIKNRWGKM